MNTKILVFLCWLLHRGTWGLPNTILLGGLLDSADKQQTVSFRNAVERINDDKSLLPRSRLVAQVENISPEDSYHTSKRACHLLKLNGGVAAILGPQTSAPTINHVQSICDALQVPHLETRWDPLLRTQSCRINLYPHSDTLSRAYLELVQAWGWRSFTIIHENNEGLIRLQSLFTSRDLQVTTVKLDDQIDLRPALKLIDTNIVLDCARERIREVLTQAQQVGLLSKRRKILITSLDLHTIDLNDFQYSNSDIRAFSIVDLKRNDLNEIEKKENSSSVKTEAALTYDAVNLLAKALHQADSVQRIDIKPLNCNGNETWPHGQRIVELMKAMQMRGLTGEIKLDENGYRSNFELSIVKLKKDGLKEIGTWSAGGGVQLEDVEEQIFESVINKTLVISSLLGEPYLMLKELPEMLTGNDRFEGYVVDLLEELSKLLGFNYEIQLVPDGKYGSLDPNTGEWNGMIKELLDGRADLAVSDLTITAAREGVIDFSMPFMTIGIGILYSKPMIMAPSLFEFLAPLDWNVWLYLILAYFGVSVLLFILSRLSPCEGSTNRDCDNPDETPRENKLTICNSLWFTTGSALHQSSNIQPKAFSTRLVAVIWWLFTLIVLCMYTANLAAFFTSGRMDTHLMTSPITSVEDLAAQNSIQFGCTRGGSTAAFFRNSENPTYRRISAAMEANPAKYTNSNREGLERVRTSRGKYAYFMESATIDYVVERHCELTRIGGLLDSKGFGIAMKKLNPFRTSISSTILKLQESGKLESLKTLWWLSKRGGGMCAPAAASDSMSGTRPIMIQHIAGVFVILFFGLGVACLIAIGEFVWKSRQIAAKKQTPLMTEMAHELRQVVKNRSSASTRPASRLHELPANEDHDTEALNGGEKKEP